MKYLECPILKNNEIPVFVINEKNLGSENLGLLSHQTEHCLNVQTKLEAL